MINGLMIVGFLPNALMEPLDESKTNNLGELKEEVDKLKSLLDDPHPGLFSWCMCFTERMTNISNYWKGGN